MTERQEVTMTACIPECARFWNREDTAHDQCPEYLGDRFRCRCSCHRGEEPKPKENRRVVRARIVRRKSQEA